MPIFEGVYGIGSRGYLCVMPLNPPAYTVDEFFPTLLQGLDTPIGLVEWYKDPPFERLVCGISGDKYACPMRGSKRGIAVCSREPELSYSYEYAMLDKYIDRLDKYRDRTGKRVLLMRGVPCFLKEIHSSARRKVYEKLSRRDIKFGQRNGHTVFVMAENLPYDQSRAVSDLATALLTTLEL